MCSPRLIEFVKVLPHKQHTYLDPFSGPILSNISQPGHPSLEGNFYCPKSE